MLSKLSSKLHPENQVTASTKISGLAIHSVLVTRPTHTISPQQHLTVHLIFTKEVWWSPFFTNLAAFAGEQIMRRHEQRLPGDTQPAT